MSVLSHQTLVGTMTKMVADAGIFLQYQKGLITKSQAIQLMLIGESTPFYKEFIESQFDNPLPNSSSGSFVNALLDLDGAISAYEESEGFELTNDEYDAFMILFEQMKSYLDV